MEAFKGKFTRTSAENFEEFLKVSELFINIPLCQTHLFMSKTFFCVKDIILCQQHLSASKTSFCVKDIFLCQTHLSVSKTSFCVKDTTTENTQKYKHRR